MAKLTGTAALVGLEWFSLTPVKNLGDDATEYMFELWPGPTGDVLMQTFSVADWQMGHDDVWLLARALAEAPTLVNSTVPIDLWRNGKTKHAYLYTNIPWMHTIMWGNRRRQGLAIRLFYQDQNDASNFRTFFLQTSVEQATQFGLNLEREIIEASPRWAKENDHKLG